MAFLRQKRQLPFLVLSHFFFFPSTWEQLQCFLHLGRTRCVLSGLLSCSLLAAGMGWPPPMMMLLQSSQRKCVCVSSSACIHTQAGKQEPQMEAGGINTYSKKFPDLLFPLVLKIQDISTNYFTDKEGFKIKSDTQINSMVPKVSLKPPEAPTSEISPFFLSNYNSVPRGKATYWKNFRRQPSERGGNRKDAFLEFILVLELKNNWNGRTLSCLNIHSIVIGVDCDWTIQIRQNMC